MCVEQANRVGELQLDHAVCILRSGLPSALFLARLAERPARNNPALCGRRHGIQDVGLLVGHGLVQCLTFLSIFLLTLAWWFCSVANCALESVRHAYLLET